MITVQLRINNKWTRTKYKRLKIQNEKLVFSILVLNLNPRCTSYQFSELKWMAVDVACLEFIIPQIIY